VTPKGCGRCQCRGYNSKGIQAAFRVYVEAEMQITPGDTIYLSSDGICGAFCRLIAFLCMLEMPRFTLGPKPNDYSKVRSIHTSTITTRKNATNATIAGDLGRLHFQGNTTRYGNFCYERYMTSCFQQTLLNRATQLRTILRASPVASSFSRVFALITLYILHTAVHLIIFTYFAPCFLAMVFRALPFLNHSIWPSLKV